MSCRTHDAPHYRAFPWVHILVSKTKRRRISSDGIEHTKESLGAWRRPVRGVLHRGRFPQGRACEWCASPAWGPVGEVVRYFTESRTAALAVASAQVLSALSLLVFVAPVATLVRRVAGERGRRPWCSVGLSLTAGPPRIGDATWRRRAGVWGPRARGSLPPDLTFGRCPSTPPPNTIPTGIQVKEKMMEGRSRQVERFIEQPSSATRIGPACRTHSGALSRRSRNESPR
jgi:hypothetical protein